MESTSAQELTPQQIELAQRAIAYYYEMGYTDGLPVVPPSAELVQEFIDYSGRDAEEVVAAVEHLDRACTVRLAAINAVMAGCLKEYFPVLLAALDALNNTSHGGIGGGMMQSTSGQCQLIIVNGPIRERLGFNSRGNIFGPGFRPNATVGRAFRLIVLNVLGILPHEFDQSTHGTPAKYSFCIAENEEESPWEPLHVERGFPAEASVVTAHFARSNLHVENRVSARAEEVMLTIADSMSNAGARSGAGGGGYCVVMAPQHASLIAGQGWSKQAVKEFLWEHWGRRRGDLRRFGLQVELGSEGPDDEFLRFGASPDSILLVVAGANNAGLSTVIPCMPHFFSAPVREPAA